jgi:hypothetical protein
MTDAILSHPFDASLMLRDEGAGNLSASANTSSKAVNGVIRKGLAVQIVIPQATGTTPTLLAAVQLSTDDSTFYEVARNFGGAQTPNTEGDVWIIPFVVPAGRYYVRVAFTVAGTTPDFGEVLAGVIPNPGANYDRDNHWL